MTVWHVPGGSNVVAFPGVRVRQQLSLKQFSKLHDILEKVEGYADWPHDWPEEY